MSECKILKFCCKCKCKCKCKNDSIGLSNVLEKPILKQVQDPRVIPRAFDDCLCDKARHDDEDEY